MTLRRLFYWLLGLAAGTAWFLLGVYIYKFGNLVDPTLSGNRSDWGTFGDFIGGTLGTYFGFLAFIGVLFTVLLQDKQLKHVRSQSHLDELQRLVAGISKVVDELLHTVPLNPPKLVQRRLPGERFTVFRLISAVGTAALQPLPDDYILRVNRDELNADLKASLAHEADLLSIELQNLTWCLEQYSAEGGSSTVTAFYIRRYAAVVCWLDVTGLLSSDAVRTFFNPAALRQQLRG